MKILISLLILSVVYLIYVIVHYEVIKIDLTPFRVRYGKLKTAWTGLTMKIKAMISIFKTTNMADEIIYAKARISKMEFADPITSAAGLATAVWEEQPLTLRDDEVGIGDADPTEDEIYSNENDAPEDYDISGGSTAIAGSFIKTTRAQLVDHFGGTVVGADDASRFHRSAKRLLINKAIKLTLVNGSDIIVPNAKGYVLLKSVVSVGGRTKYPFKFIAMVASSTWDVDIIW